MSKQAPETKTNHDILGRTLGIFVETKIGRKIPSKTYEDWLIFARTTKLLDVEIDNTKDITHRRNLEQQVINLLKNDTAELKSGNNILDDYALQLKTSVWQLPINQREGFISGSGALFKVIERTRETTNPIELARLKRLEGQITIRLALDFLPKDFKQDKNYRRADRLISRLLRLGTSGFDAAWDLPNDRKNGEVLVQPTVGNRISLFTQSWRDFPATEILRTPIILPIGLYWFFCFSNAMVKEKMTQ